MKRTLLSLFVSLCCLTGFAQNTVSFGPSTVPMSKWGANAFGDFKVLSLGSRASVGLGAFVFGDIVKASEDSPNPGKTIKELYLAPQLSVHYQLSGRWDSYLRGGPGWFFMDNKNDFLFNIELGTRFALNDRWGLFAEVGLPFSSIGVSIAL